MSLRCYSQRCFEIFTSVAFAEPCASPGARGASPGSAGMLGPQAKCDSAQGKSLPRGCCPVLEGGGSHQEFSFKRSQILSLKHISSAKGDLRSLKNGFLLLGPYPLCCFSDNFGLVCFTRKNHSKQEQCVVSFGLMS